jgi:hypothetical protein
LEFCFQNDESSEDPPEVAVISDPKIPMSESEAKDDLSSVSDAGSEKAISFTKALFIPVSLIFRFYKIKMEIIVEGLI